MTPKHHRTGTLRIVLKCHASIVTDFREEIGGSSGIHDLRKSPPIGTHHSPSSPLPQEAQNIQEEDAPCFSDANCGREARRAVTGRPVHLPRKGVRLFEDYSEFLICRIDDPKI